MFLYRDISEYLFCNPVGVVYHHLNIDGSETSYNQSEMICNQVADGLYVMQGSISLFNPNSKGVFLLVVMKRDSVSFKNENVNWSYIGKSVTDRSLDLFQRSWERVKPLESRNCLSGNRLPPFVLSQFLIGTESHDLGVHVAKLTLFL
jgi:hypothetical protein